MGASGAGQGVKIRAGDGDDIVYGNYKDNRIFGEDGDDRLSGESGDDWIEGGHGSDVIRGGAGTNTLWGDIEPERKGPSAEDFDASDGVGVYNKGATIQIGGTQDGDWVRYDAIDFGEADDTTRIDLATEPLDFDGLLDALILDHTDAFALSEGTIALSFVPTVWTDVRASCPRTRKAMVTGDT